MASSESVILVKASIAHCPAPAEGALGTLAGWIRFTGRLYIVRYRTLQGTSPCKPRYRSTQEPPCGLQQPLCDDRLRISSANSQSITRAKIKPFPAHPRFQFASSSSLPPKLSPHSPIQAPRRRPGAPGSDHSVDTCRYQSRPRWARPDRNHPPQTSVATILLPLPASAPSRPATMTELAAASLSAGVAAPPGGQGGVARKKFAVPPVKSACLAWCVMPPLSHTPFAALHVLSSAVSTADDAIPAELPGPAAMAPSHVQLYVCGSSDHHSTLVLLFALGLFLDRFSRRPAEHCRVYSAKAGVEIVSTSQADGVGHDPGRSRDLTRTWPRIPQNLFPKMSWPSYRRSRQTPRKRVS